MKDNLLGSLLALSTTLLTKNLVEPVLNLHCFLDLKCLSSDLSMKPCDLVTFGPFQSINNSNQGIRELV